tara:strand:- start:310 stop:714 length:405 start_codon:yes stop_codon:yes gene_type:complete
MATGAAQWEQRHQIPRLRRYAEIGGGQKDNLLFAQKNTGLPGKHHERMKGGQLMVDPPPEETHPQNHRRADPQERLLEIGAHLFGDVVLARGRNHIAGRIRDGIEITDQRCQFDARRQGQLRAPISGHTNRGQR